MTKSRIKVISIILAMSMFFLATVTGGASQEEEVAADSPVMGTSLGQSGTLIEKPEDLKALSTSVNGGEDQAGKFFTLTVDIDMSEIEDWEPIGTKENPFKGTFDGNNHTIFKMGTENAISLFGYTENATLKNINISSVLEQTASEYTGLFINIKKSTIENCRVFYDRGLSAFITRTNIAPDVSWFDIATPLTAYDFSSVSNKSAVLLGLAEIVNTGLYDFAGTTFILGSIDLTDVGNEWPGIGRLGAPFKGDVDGGKITGLTSQRPSDSYVGLFGNVEDASFKNISVIDANILGGESVGALIGQMKETTVEDCMSSGAVTGTNYVGGLIGQIKDTDAIDSPTRVKWCFSTADVVGVTAIGGVIGGVYAAGEQHVIKPHDSPVEYVGFPNDTVPTDTEIQYCFSTGNINGTILVGGIVGYSAGPDDLVGLTISDCSSSGVIRGSGKIGGILGSGKSAMIATYVFNCYTTSTVYAHSDSGLIIGANAWCIFTYTSGHIVAPDVYLGSWEGAYISRFVGLLEGAAYPTDIGYAEANSIYSYSNYMNQDPTAPTMHQNTKRKLGDNEALAIEFFDVGVNVTTDLLNTTHGASGFSAANLTYTGTGRNIVATAGNYPKLASFEGSGKTAFKRYSNITTEVASKSLPNNAFYDGSKVVDIYGQEIVLPAIPGIMWNINSKTGAHTVTDPTIASGENKIEIVGNKFVVNDKFVVGEDVIISALVPGVDGLEIKYSITFVDEVIRPVLSSVPAEFYGTQSEATAASAKYLSTSNEVIILSFTEPISFVSSGSPNYLTLDEYSDNNFGGAVQTHTNVAEAEIINNTILKISVPPGFFSNDKSYELKFDDTIGTNETIADNSGIKWNQSYFFKTNVNTAPILSYDMNYSLATPQNTVGDVQDLELKENDSRFFTIFDGILAKDDTFVQPRDAKIIKLVSNGNAGDDGSSGYPAFDNNPASTNLYKIPGEYVIEYQLEDREEAGLLSNILTRTYKVDGEVVVTQGGGNLKPIEIEFTRDELSDLMATAPTAPLNQVINTYLEDRYINTPGAEQIKAYKYNTQGKRETKSIVFNVGHIKDDAALKGLDALLSFTVEDGESYNFSLEIESTLPNKEIVVVNTSYTVDRDRYVVNSTYSKGKARAFFGAKVVEKGNPGKVFSDQLKYDFSEVNPYKFDIPQEVTITFVDTEQFDYLGNKYDPSVKVLITIREKLTWEHDEEKWSNYDMDRDGYWDGKIETIRKMESDKQLLANLSFYDGMAAPRNFFTVLGGKDSVEAEFTLPNDYILKFSSENTYPEELPEDRAFYNFNVEGMFSYHVERDAKGAATHQFYTSGQFDLPCTVSLSMPFDENMTKKGLSLYFINKDTGEYELEQKVSSSSIKDGRLILELDSFKGEYVVTTAKLEGVKTSLDLD